MKVAGVDKGDLGYLKEEASLEMRSSAALDRSNDRDDLKAVIDAEFSHDIVTEDEAQQTVLKDVERVTGARSVAVTRYGSYETKLHGRNQLGVLKQGDFERIGGHGDYREEQGISADGGHIKSVNTAIAGQSAEFAADGSKIVDDGSADYQVTQLKYDAAGAAAATSYSAANQKSSGKSGALSDTDAVMKARQAQAQAQAKRDVKAQQMAKQLQRGR